MATPKISVELIPPNLSKLRSFLPLLKTQLPQLEMLNFPTLLNRQYNGLHAARLALNHFNTAVPHIRACDFNLDDEEAVKTFFAPYLDLDHILVVSGDQPKDKNRPWYPTTTLDMVPLLKKWWPNVKIYVALDPYRQGWTMEDELNYLEQKLDCGADGVFTQPFFDLYLLMEYQKYLWDVEVFWGVSPILSQWNYEYWPKVNNVEYPSNFKSGFEEQVALAHSVLAFAHDADQHTYFMPIAKDENLILKYLKSILN